MDSCPGLRFGEVTTVCCRPPGVAQLNVDLFVERPGEIRNRTKRKLCLPAEITIQIPSADADQLRKSLLSKPFLRSPFEDGGGQVAADICDETAGRPRPRPYLKPK